MTKIEIKHLKIIAIVCFIILVVTITIALIYSIDGIMRFERETFTVSGKIFQIACDGEYLLFIVNFTEQKEYKIFIKESLIYERNLGEPHVHRLYDVGDNVIVTYYRQWLPSVNIAINIEKLLEENKDG